MKRNLLMLTITAFLICGTAVKGQIILLGSFNPSEAGGLCGIAYDPETEYIWTYGCNAQDIQSYATNGDFVAAIPLLTETANDVDLDIAPESLNIGNTVVPAGQLLMINGETDEAEIYALDNLTGVIIDTLNSSFGNSHVVGGSYHDQRNTFYMIQDNVPSAALENMIAEIDPVSGETLQTVQITSVFRVSYGDIEVASSGNLFVVSSIEDSIAEFSPVGVLVKKHGLPTGVSDLSGIALNCETNEAWVCNTSGVIFHLGQFPCTASLGINLTEPSPVNIVSVSPNPFGSETTFTIKMVKSDMLNIRLLNASGHEMMTIFEGKAQSGTNVFSLPGQDLSDGMYFIIAESNGYAVVKKLVKADSK